MDINLGNSIKKLRMAKSVTQEELAEYLGISFQAVSKWETGTTMPDITLLPKIAAFFGVRIDELFAIDHADELERIHQILTYESLTEHNYLYAKRILEAMLQENAEEVAVLKNYARLHLKKANQDLLSAGRMLEKAMELAPLDAEVYGLYRQVRGGDRYSVHSGNDWFIRVCEPYAQKYPQFIELNIMLIEAMIQMEYFERAEKYIQSMHCDGKWKYMREIFLGDIEVAKGNRERAKVIWDMIPRDHHWGQYQIGERYNRLNEYEKAIECFQNSFRAAETPRLLDAVFSLAFLHTKLKRYKEAIADWQCIIDVFASD